LWRESRKNEESKPIVFVFDAAQFGNLRGSVPEPVNVIKRTLGHVVKERKAPAYATNVDEYLTSQICPGCATRTAKDEIDLVDSKSYPVKACSN
jgi:hypothetical protein